MNRGKGRQDIFCGDDYFQAFLDTVGEPGERFNAIIHCYCLMSNHYHLLIETPCAPNWLRLSDIEGAGGFNRKNGTYAAFVEGSQDDVFASIYDKKKTKQHSFCKF